MIKFVLILLVFPTIVYATDVRVAKQISTGKIIEMQRAATPGTLIGNAVSGGFQENDLVEITMSLTDYNQAMDAQWSDNVISARVKKMAEIRALATALSAKYPPAFWSQGSAYQTGLATMIVSATNDISGLDDIATIKNYQPAWPPVPTQ